MIKFGVYPKVIAEIIGNIPTIAFKTVSWTEFLGASSKTVKRYAKGDVDPKLYSELSKLLPNQIELISNLRTEPMSLVTAKNVLRIYFLQFKNPQGLFLDLRASHFQEVGETTHWKPNALYHQLQENFRLGILKLYQGFYTDDLDLFYQAMDEIGLTKGLNQSKKEELKNLFYSHFGDSEHTTFKISSFNESFFKIFEFFMQHKIKLQTDFIFLGAYLVTLYMHLERYDEAINVKEIYHEVF
jgi:hypothetical protein